MSTKTITICDICKVEKRDINHWWQAIIVKGHLEPMINIRVWIKTTSTEVAHLCGEECLNKWINQNLSKLKREKESEKEK